MPELAEVEYFRHRWDDGFGKVIIRVHLNEKKRVFRGVDTILLANTLMGAKLQKSAGHGKRMLFRFSNGVWLGVHLGMTGKLSAEPPDFKPGKHDHLVLFQKDRALVFHDPRLFGRIQFYQGSDDPVWWSNLPPQPHESS